MLRAGLCRASDVGLASERGKHAQALLAGRAIEIGGPTPSAPDLAACFDDGRERNRMLHALRDRTTITIGRGPDRRAVRRSTGRHAGTFIDAER